MPTIFSHVAPALVLGLALGRERISRPLLVCASIAAISPDFDGISFWLDMPRGTLLSHRGFTHSIGFASMIAGLGAIFAPHLGCKRWVAALVLFLATLSHPLYDMLTNGGSGVALWWPFSSQRVFFEWRPIAVAPISAARLFSERGWNVLRSELGWIWLPWLGIGLIVAWLRRRYDTSKAQIRA